MDQHAHYADGNIHANSHTHGYTDAHAHLDAGRANAYPVQYAHLRAH